METPVWGTLRCSGPLLCTPAGAYLHAYGGGDEEYRLQAQGLLCQHQEGCHSWVLHAGNQCCRGSLLEICTMLVFLSCSSTVTLSVTLRCILTFLRLHCVSLHVAACQWYNSIIAHVSQIVHEDPMRYWTHGLVWHIFAVPGLC